MATSLYVWAHWSDQGAVQPPPAWATSGAYPPAAVPLQAVTAGGRTASWSGPPGPSGADVLCWLPVVRSADLDAIGWAHRLAGGTLSGNWPGPPPPYFPSFSSGAPASTVNLGYADAATDFLVRRVRFWLEQVTGPDFSCELVAPSGVSAGSANLSTSGWSPWITLPAPTSGKGIWTVRINRQAGSRVSAPQFLPDPALMGGAQTFVSPYGNREGILGAEFDGEEVLPPVTVNVQTAMTGGGCRQDGSRDPAVFTLQFTPALPAGWTYVASWRSMRATPPSTISGTGPRPSISGTIAYPPGLSGADTVEADLTLIPPGGAPTTRTFGFSVTLTACTAQPPCPAISVTATPPHACVGTGGAARIDFRATTMPAGYVGPYYWSVIDLATGQALPIPVPAPAGPVFTYVFGQVGTYEVRVDIRPPAGVCAPPGDRPLATVRIAIASCACPTITAPIAATAGADGCSWSFSTQVTSPPGTTTTYAWDFGDGQTSSQPPPVTHRYAAGMQGQRTVTLTVGGSLGGDGRPCAATASVPIEVRCGGGDCPDFDGDLTATPRAGSPCTFDVAAAIRNPAGRTTQLDWTLPDGSSVMAPSASATVAPGARGNIRVTLRSPGCPDVTRAVQIRCSRDDRTTIACDFLLWLAAILFGVGALLAVIGCLMTVFAQWPFTPGALNPTLYLWGWKVGIFGAILAGLGVVAFILWVALCSEITACSVMRAVYDFMLVFKWIFAAIAGLIGLLAALLGAFGLPIQAVVWQLLACAGAAIATHFGFGAAMDIIYKIAKRRRCLEWINEAPSQSSAPLTDDAGGRGFGTMIQNTTSSMGFASCAGCEGRARALDRILPFGQR